VDPWWEALPELLDVLAARWSLVVGEPVGRGNTSLVLRCRRAGGGAAVLKLCPDPALTAAEGRALRAWARSGRVPAVWECDGVAGALLLEAIADETPVSERPGAVALGAVADLIGALHATGDPRGFDPLADRVEFVFAHWIRRNAGRSSVPVERLERGAELARALAAEPAPAVLLHGDMHPANVLDGGAGRGLVAIDPRPCAGDPAMDAVDWVFHRVPDPAEWEPRSRALAASMGCDPERLWRWCRAFAAMIAASRAVGGAGAEEVAALLALGP
jgi:streptomycin 6-kinase